MTQMELTILPVTEEYFWTVSSKKIVVAKNKKNLPDNAIW
jgi:hypothetical protein